MTEPRGQGLVQVFTGDGKGKTTAALGTVLRAVGHGLRVFVVVFMKGDFPYGEYRALSLLPGVTVACFGFESFCDPQNVREEEREEARKALAAGREALLSGHYDVVVLDEVNVAAAWRLVEPQEMASLIRERPREVELILTGRYADASFLELADLVTDMKAVKHPYQKGVKARRGIDY